jgi:selenocysteine lyase/cysteine desulfurase
MSSGSEIDVDELRAAYSRFLAGGRVLLTGHSHQAWPDVVRDALAAGFDEAAELVDDKWDRAVFPRVERVGRAILERSGFDGGDAIAFGRSTHELVFRLLTCLPLHARPRIVTTKGEFHSLHRQLSRLEEEGVDVVWVDALPREGIADRLIEAIVPGTKMVAFSAVLFEDAFVVPRLPEILERARAVDAIALVDAYHAFNVVPLELGPAAADAFVTAGGYKYAEFGEGICWMRLPEGKALRPIDTGWFADFGSLSAARGDGVAYGPKGMRFGGGTFDPMPFARAEAVLQHYGRFGLSVPRLRAISLRQTRRIIAALDADGLGDRVISSRDDARRGGFVAVRASEAIEITKFLRERDVLVDARNDILRLGPAPYVTDADIDRGVAELARLLRR